MCLGLNEKGSAGATSHPEHNIWVTEITRSAALESPPPLCAGTQVPLDVVYARGHSPIPRRERSEMQFGLIWEKKA